MTNTVDAASLSTTRLEQLVERYRNMAWSARRSAQKAAAQRNLEAVLIELGRRK